MLRAVARQPAGGSTVDRILFVAEIYTASDVCALLLIVVVIRGIFGGRLF